MTKFLGVCSAFCLLTACGARGTDPGSTETPPGASTVVVGTPNECSFDSDCGDESVCVDGMCLLADDPVGTPPPVDEPGEPDVTPPPTGESDEPNEPPKPPVDGATASKVDGTWEGYVEAYSFMSGSDAIRVEIHSDGCTPSATITFGEGEPLPPVEDPDVGYPFANTTNSPFGGLVRWYEGEAYEAHSIEISKKRVQIDISMNDVWTEWCEMQTPYPMDESGEGFMCVPNYGFSWSEEGCVLSGPDGGIPMDCGKIELCQFGPCLCDESGCGVPSGGDTTLDVALDDGHLEGTFEGFGPVRLYRVK